jgi:hypothetical protein
MASGDRCSIEAQRDAHRRADAMLQTLALLLSNLRLAEAARVVGEIHARLPGPRLSTLSGLGQLSGDQLETTTSKTTLRGPLVVVSPRSL